VRWRTDAAVFDTERKREPLQAYLQGSGISNTRTRNEENSMHIALTVGPLVSLIAGILILVVPRLLNFIVAIYLIVIGLLGLFGSGNFHL
jgi:Protein of unknown function (DUF3096)